ncbi:hypothetical protein XELAEV_18035393mg [Xenopus laevis]|uniref:Uncharacterized protein n=1 Tax=Xenopus laevis TaxID=8355 RepID=A0A974CFK7_XENLA|nr:hypothetical protein XELAEV_18035393mg [Xenopus laevis]
MHRAELTTDITDNPLLYSTWQTWKELRKQNNLKSSHSLYLPLLSNPEFQSGRALTIYRDWGEEGLTTICQLTMRDTPQTYTSRTIRLLTDEDWDNALDRFLLRTNSTRGTISLNYKFLHNSIDYDSIPKGPREWTVDIPELTTEERRDSSSCPKCEQTGANLIHCLWSCPYIRRFWTQVRDYATRHLVNFVPLSAAWAIWGKIPTTHSRITQGARRLLLIVSAVARKTILQVWITTTPPTIKLFLEKLVRVFHMDWTEASLNKNTIVKWFFETWETFIDICPQTVKIRLHDCFHYTEWYITRTMSGDPPINI